MNYYVLNSDHTISGPFSAIRMLHLHQTCRISDATPAAAQGDSDWQPFSDLLPVVKYEAIYPSLPTAGSDVQAQIEAAKKSGPPTPQVLVKLLKEDEPFPRPRRRQQYPPSPLLLNRPPARSASSVSR